MCEICSILIRALDRHYWHRSDIIISNLNNFHKLFCYFHSSLSTNKYRQGYWSENDSKMTKFSLCHFRFRVYIFSLDVCTYTPFYIITERSVQHTKHWYMFSHIVGYITCFLLIKLNSYSRRTICLPPIWLIPHKSSGVKS